MTFKATIAGVVQVNRVVLMTRAVAYMSPNWQKIGTSRESWAPEMTIVVPPVSGPLKGSIL